MTDPNSISQSQLLDENKRLRRAVEELSILNELARAIGALNNSQEIIEIITRKSMRAVSAEQGVITLVGGGTNDPFRTLVRTVSATQEHERYHFNQTLVGWMHLNKKPLVLNNPREDERFRGVEWDSSIRSLMCVPLITKSELKGVLTVYNKKGTAGFSEDDQRILAIIAVQSAQVIENARLYEQEKSLVSIQEQVRLASKIQEELLPKSFPRIDGYEVAGRSLSAQQVGGDYFDFIPAPDSGWAICLGDVSGKGLPASLLMANVQATLRGQTLLATSARECVGRSNKLLYDSTSDEKFVTLFYGLLDPRTHTFRYSNAGHDHPFIFSASGEFTRLDTGGIVLSMFESFPFEEGVVNIAPGDVLVIYSDGVTEAMNLDGDQFGEKQLENVLRIHRERPASEIIAAVIEAVKVHAKTAPQSDDITMVVVKRTA